MVDTVEDGDSVLLSVNRGSLISHMDTLDLVSRRKGRRFAKARDVDVNAVVGRPWGHLFEVRDGMLAPVPPTADVLLGEEEEEEEEKDDEADGAAGGRTRVGGVTLERVKENDELFSEHAVQTLNSDGVEALRQQGASGMDIVQRAVAGSGSFASKNKFAQNKYIERKKRKYVQLVRAVRPTPMSVCRLTEVASDGNSGFLRQDSLAMLLSRSGVRAGSRVLVLDETEGLVTGSLLTRLGDTGEIVALHNGAVETRALGKFELSNAAWANLHHVSLRDALYRNVARREADGEEARAAQRATDPNFERGSEAVVDGVLTRVKAVDETDAERAVRAARVKAVEANDPLKAHLRQVRAEKRSEWAEMRGKRYVELTGRAKELMEDGFDHLVIVSDFDPLTAMRKLMPLLRANGRFAIFSTSSEGLARASLDLRDDAVDVTLVETITRKYQVLPQRTHPHLWLDGASGYILAGTKTAGETVVLDNTSRKTGAERANVIEQVGRRNKRKKRTLE